MYKIARFFGNPGVRTDIKQQAPIPCDRRQDDSKKGLEEIISKEIETDSESSLNSVLGQVHVEQSGDIITSIGFTGLRKGKMDKALDKLVEYAGSVFTFVLMWIIMIIWVIMGIVSSASSNWQVVMQDGQSIQCYIWDTLLMRQQLMSAHEHVCVCAELKSRLTIFKKLMYSIASSSEKTDSDIEETLYDDIPEVTADLQNKTWYDRLSSNIAHVIGSWYFIVIYWAGIFVWIGCGALYLDANNDPPYTGETTGSNPKKTRFGNMWQMYINTATAVLMFFCTIFLQNLRARHDRFVAKFIREIFEIDLKIDVLLRDEANDYFTESDVVCIKRQKRNKADFLIDWYGDVVGTGIGVLLAIAVLTAWIAVGHLMDYSDNWWLIIGTYTGLVGFFDGFVIRQNYFRIVNHEQENYSSVLSEEYELYSILGIQCPKNLSEIPVQADKSVTYKVSVFINKICSSKWSVLASLLIIIGLISVASGMHWSQTGQLLANTPTMIIEGFFLLILLQAHNWADIERRAEISLLHSRKTFMLTYLEKKFNRKAIDINLN